MREQTVAIYCLLDDLLRVVQPTGPQKADPRRRLSDAQVLTTALLAARYFGGNLVVAQQYLEQHWGMNKLDKSNFCRHLHRLRDTLWALFAAFGALLKQLSCQTHYVIDSFPVAVCHNTRIERCRLLEGEAYRGRCASKREWFYGFKVQLVISAEGLPVDCYIHAGSEADITGLKALSPELPAGSVLYADAAYTDYAWEELFAEATECRLLSARRGNSKCPRHPAENFLIQHHRKAVETEFSTLTARFPKRIHAVTAEGFVLKIMLFVFTHTLAQAGR
jgi:Transposase DDE domain